MDEKLWLNYMEDVIIIATRCHANVQCNVFFDLSNVIRHYSSCTRIYKLKLIVSTQLFFSDL